jgi:DNA-binding NtrC family response regulator
MEVNDAAVSAFRQGLFRRAHETLTRQETASVANSLLCAETFQFLGQTVETSRIIARLMRSGGLDSRQSARCTALLADAKWYDGNLPGALDLYRKAHDLARASGDVVLTCRTAAQLLERVSDGSGLDRSLPLAAFVRKAVARSGDPQMHAFVHLTFARLEAKAGRFSVAQRHFGLARNDLRNDPNLYLDASLDVDESVALWLFGDVAGAIDLAERGASKAAECGWARGLTAAAANLACLYVSCGRLHDAHDKTRDLLSVQFLTPSLKLATADTLARAFVAAGDYERAEAVLAEQVDRNRIQSWYKLTADQTRVQLLLRQSRWHEAISQCSHSIGSAREAKLQPLVSFFHLARAQACIAQSQRPSDEDLPLSYGHEDFSLEAIGQLHSALGAALSKWGNPGRGSSQIARGMRIFLGTGNVYAARLHEKAVAVDDAERNHAQASLQTCLDAAVALLELSGHPHIFGQEAFALIKDAGCAEGLALAAVGATGLRLIATDGWTEAEAGAAMRAAAADDLITVGHHRDETWQIVARPRPELDHRCTLAAIRKLIATARTLDQFRRDEKERAALWPAEELEGDAESLWISEQSSELLRIARRIANAPLPVLLTGETGTGKEMLARVIHRASDRAERPLQPFNCTAVPRDMLESQLFGYRKGAFTGAESAFAGVIRAAAGGTLFLDEIGDVTIDVQPKLLRFLEQQEVHPFGEPHPVKVDVRIVAATNGNLDELVAQGRFREDLLYRLKGLHLHLPPLRERREEIPALAQHYIRKYADEQRKGQLTLSDEALEYLLLYAWPGNIRQLANEVRRMIALAEPNSTLTPTLLSPEILASRRTIAVTPSVTEPEIRLRLDQPLPIAVETLEQTLVRRALERSHGRVEEAARLLGISRKGLFLKRRRWGLQQAS